MLCIMIYDKEAVVSDTKHELIQVTVAANVNIHKTFVLKLVINSFQQLSNRVTLLAMIPLQSYRRLLHLAYLVIVLDQE